MGYGHLEINEEDLNFAVGCQSPCVFPNDGNVIPYLALLAERARVSPFDSLVTIEVCLQVLVRSYKAYNADKFLT